MQFYFVPYQTHRARSLDVAIQRFCFTLSRSALFRSENAGRLFSSSLKYNDEIKSQASDIIEIPIRINCNHSGERRTLWVGFYRAPNKTQRKKMPFFFF